MSLLQALSSEELAQQLRDPAGATGLAVADALGAANREGNAGIVSSLALSRGDRVLEVGCGLATMAGTVVAAADDVLYTGLDQSSTMVEGARARYAELEQSGRVMFHLGRVEQMPFDAARFTKVFSVGVVHFWAEPIACLVELRRVMQPGALMAMGGLGPDHAP
jgi:ubiquinone/menaquinone biosynthesis C-methylase UbiE